MGASLVVVGADAFFLLAGSEKRVVVAANETLEGRDLVAAAAVAAGLEKEAGTARAKAAAGSASSANTAKQRATPPIFAVPTVVTISFDSCFRQVRRHLKGSTVIATRRFNALRK